MQSDSSAESKNIELRKTEGTMVVASGWGHGGNRELLVKEYILWVTTQMSSKDLMYSMVNIVDFNVLYPWNLLGE